MKKGDKGNLHALEQEWDSLQVKDRQILYYLITTQVTLLVTYLNPLPSLVPANVICSDTAASRPPADHSGNVQRDHVGEHQGGGGAGVQLGRQEHRTVHPTEAGELLG